MAGSPHGTCSATVSPSETRQLRIALTLGIYRNIFRDRELHSHPSYDPLWNSAYNVNAKKDQPANGQL